MSYINPVSGIIDQLVKRDSIGRRNKGWIKPGPGRNKHFDIHLGVSLDNETYQELKKKANGNIAKKIREYIEWGLENDK